MQTVILAGGKGERVFPLAVNEPKAMFKLLGKPIIQYVIETAKQAGLNDFIVVTGHGGEVIEDFLGDGSRFGCRVQYTSQKEAHGMADALKIAENLIEAEIFFVMNVTDIFDTSLIKSMIEKFKTSDAHMVLSCKPVKDPSKFGVIALDGDRVLEILEKPEKGKEPSNLAIIGAYILPKKIFEYYDVVGTSDKQFEEAIQKFIENGEVVRAEIYDGFFGAFKHPWDLFTLNDYLMEKFLTKSTFGENTDISKNAIIEGNVWIEEGVQVYEGAVIRGPCYIGRGSKIGNDTLIRNHSSIGNNCLIGYSCEIKNSIIGDECWLHKNYVGDSIIGNRCVLGAGTITANLRFDKRTIVMKIRKKEKEEHVDTGRVKMGAIIGDNCRVGINSSIMPGVKIGPNSIVGPNVCLDEDLEPNKTIRIDKKSYIIKQNKL